MKSIVFNIAGKDYTWGLDTSPSYIVKELDLFSIRIPIDIGENISFYVEDYQISLIARDEFYISEQVSIFRESFGVSAGRLVVDTEIFEVFFDVLALKVTAQKIEKMLSFLHENNKKILSIVFSRSSAPRGLSNNGDVEPEVIIRNAEVFVNKFMELRQDLVFNLRKRLVPEKVPVWMSKDYVDYFDIDDFFESIDRLSPTASEGDVLINGRMFSVDKIYKTDLVESSATYENSVLLGGAFSILNKVRSLLNFLKESFSRGQAVYDKEYESIGNFIARVTYDAIEFRCLILIEKLEEIVKFLKDDLRIKYRGEIFPRVTPYVRGVKVYRILFDQLANWYNLGSPDFKGLVFLSKMRSISKIYELFCLYRICFVLHQQGWQVISSEESDDFGCDVPKIVVFEKKDQIISVKYESKIKPVDRDMAHLALVSLDHKIGWSRGFYSPDYIIEHKFSDEVNYFIFDAKYSSKFQVMKKDDTGHLNQIFKKYYDGLGVVDLNRGTISSNRIIAVSVLYPNDEGELSGYGSSQKTHGLQRIPIKNAVSLRDDEDKTFEIFLERLISLSSKLMG
jgi:hypothetical protein